MNGTDGMVRMRRSWQGTSGYHGDFVSNANRLPASQDMTCMIRDPDFDMNGIMEPYPRPLRVRSEIYSKHLLL